MPTSVTNLFPPSLRDSSLPKGLERYLFTLQRLSPLYEVDTTSGPYSEAVPPAGLSSTATGASNQNMEITYVKTSADANVFTLTGVQLGALTLTAQGDHFKIKSDGTNWWRVA
jgi:hypothetical protein